MLDILFINPTDRVGLCAEVNGTLILGTKLLQAGFQVQVLRFFQIEGEGLPCAVLQGKGAIGNDFLNLIFAVKIP